MKTSEPTADGTGRRGYPKTRRKPDTKQYGTPEERRAYMQLAIEAHQRACRERRIIALLQADPPLTESQLARIQPFLTPPDGGEAA
jgi:hypothetical protein